MANYAKRGCVRVSFNGVSGYTAIAGNEYVEFNIVADSAADALESVCDALYCITAVERYGQKKTTFRDVAACHIPAVVRGLVILTCDRQEYSDADLCEAMSRETSLD